MKLPHFWVNAFTVGGLDSGNPCAVVLDAEPLSDGQMLAIAKEMNLSETAFLSRSSRADFRARYFTPEREIPLAGHPTLASTRALLEAGRARAPGLTLELTAGIVRVDIADGGRITMHQLAPKFLRQYSAAEVAPVFGLKASDLLDSPVQTVSTGSPMLMVPVRSPDSLKSLKLDPEAYRSLRDRGDFFSPHLFCLTGPQATFARHLGLPPDTLEDPFTGSATGCMGAYLWQNRLIGEPAFEAHQGDWMGRPGRARVEILGPPGQIESVRVGGQTQVRIRGEIAI